MPLEDSYAGDNAFHRFATACEPDWANCDYQSQLLGEVGGDLDLAMALHYRHGKQALDWLGRAVPALEGLTPGECLWTEAGRRRLKECLWRTP